MLTAGHEKQVLFPRFMIWLLKWVSGFLFGFVLAVFGMSIFSYGTFSFVFTLVAAQIFFWKGFHGSGVISVLLFDAAFIFLLLMFRLYVILGPNI